ncbi:MAG: glycerophosphodiester phosphodiesterase [Proteobacteria bacterium]|nr:glycerophosphodiester phosphodiesterase [Pseudomonadota bacterium]
MPRLTPLPLTPGFLARPIAHRGLHTRVRGIIENTRAAFDAAISGGFGIECDIQASRDGEAMVFHDFTLDRLTEGTGRVDGVDAGALGEIPFLQGTSRMEPLGALLAQVAGRVPLVVEVKSRFEGDGRIATRIAALVRDYAGPLVLKSFDPGKIIALREAGVKQPLGIVATADYADHDYESLSADEKHALANLLHINESKPDFLSWDHRYLPSAAPFLCRSQLGLPVMSWTIRSREAAAKVAPHVDQIVFEGFDPA